MSAWEEFMDTLADMADKLKLADDERDSFIESGMERGGFKKTFTWSDPEPEEGGSGGDFFSGKRAQRNQSQTRQVGRQRGDGGSGSSGNWQYGG